MTDKINNFSKYNIVSLEKKHNKNEFSSGIDALEGNKFLQVIWIY